MSAAVTARPATAPWIGGRAFDLVWFFGGAALAMAAFAVVLLFRPSIVAVAWLWVLLFDGPHMMALFTRTYLDRETWRARRPLLLGALAAFVVGPMFLAVSVVTKTDAPFLLFLGGASVYGYWHVVRQHYGFAALYRAKSGEKVTRTLYAVDKGALYLGLWLPWVHFLVAHPLGRSIVGVTRAPSSGESALGAGIFAAWLVVAFGYFAVTIGRGRSGGMKAPYVMLAIAVHGFLYFVASRFEPVYRLATTPDQKLLLMTVMGGIFHSAQYVGIVFLHHARTRGARSMGRYLLICVSFSGFYLALAAATAIYPAITLFEGRTIGGVPVSRLALCLFWGIALQHYVIDQYIWRIKKDEGLRAALAS